MSANGHTVGEVARRAHVTVRTLHHYDEIGLLKPSDRSRAGYRLYSDRDLARLHEILVLRELGFSLDAIAQVLDEPADLRRRALQDQRARIVAQKHHAEAVIRAIDAALCALEGDTTMSDEKMFEGFEEFDHAQYEEEARERWGDTEAYKESARRIKRYGKAEWATIKAEAQSVTQDFAGVMAAGASPDSPQAMDVAERARLHIDRWFYPCSHQMHAALGEMYVADERFAETYNRVRPGLASFVCAAIKANLDRHASV